MLGCNRRAALIGGVIFLPTLASALLPQSWDGVFKYLPSNAAKSFTEVDPREVARSLKLTASELGSILQMCLIQTFLK